MASYLSSVAAIWKPLRATRMAERLDCCCSPSDDEVRSFCSSVSNDLRDLERSLGDGPVSLRWSADAMRILRRTQTEHLALLKKSGLPTAFGAEAGWLDLYMEETAALLDLCNHLRSVTAAITRYRMMVDLAIQKLQNGSVPELEALEFEDQNLLEATIWSTEPAPEEAAAQSPEKIGWDGSPTGVAMRAAKCATVAVSVVLVWAFLSPVSVDAGKEWIAREVLLLEPLEGAAAGLVGRFLEKCFAGAALAEQELVRGSVAELVQRLESGRAAEEGGELLGGSVDVMRRKLADLKEGIEAFDEAAGEVFDDVIRGRNDLLRTFSE